MISDKTGPKRLARDSRRVPAITQIERLDTKQIKALETPQFQKELNVTTDTDKSLANVERLHRRLDDAILLLADYQSGGDNGAALDIVVKDICNALGSKPVWP